MNLHINDFEGPLDLLLHLVRTAKMDIYEIDTKYINITFGGIYLNATEDEGDKVLDLNGNEVTDGYISKMPTKDGQHSIVYGEDEVYKIIDTFIATKNPSEDRHLRRITKVEQIENGEYHGL